MTESLQDRLTNAVAKRLGVAARFIRWERNERTGADTPIFAVPVDAIATARELGLTVEAA